MGKGAVPRTDPHCFRLQGQDHINGAINNQIYNQIGW